MRSEEFFHGRRPQLTLAAARQNYLEASRAPPGCVAGHKSLEHVHNLRNPCGRMHQLAGPLLWILVTVIANEVEVPYTVYQDPHCMVLLDRGLLRCCHQEL